MARKRTAKADGPGDATTQIPDPTTTPASRLPADLQAAQQAADDFIAVADTLWFFCRQRDPVLMMKEGMVTESFASIKKNTANHVARLVEKSTNLQPERYKAIQAVAIELRRRKVKYGSVIAASAHEAAAHLEYLTVKSIWDAVCPFRDARTKPTSAEFRRIIEHFDAVQEHFATMDYPDTKEILADVLNEAAAAARDRRSVETQEATPPGGSSANVVQYVTLQQMAAIVQRSKRTLEKKINSPHSGSPLPDVEGGGGRPHEWKWTAIRPWLESQFDKRLPDRFPTAS